MVLRCSHFSTFVMRQSARQTGLVLQMKLDKIAKKDSIKVCEFMFRSCLSGQVCTKVCVIKYEKATNTQTHTCFSIMLGTFH